MVADINVLVKLIDDNLNNYAKNIAEEDFKMNFKIANDQSLSGQLVQNNRGFYQSDQAIFTRVDKPFMFDLSNIEKVY